MKNKRFVEEKRVDDLVSHLEIEILMSKDIVGSMAANNYETELRNSVFCKLLNDFLQKSTSLGLLKKCDTKDIEFIVTDYIENINNRFYDNYEIRNDDFEIDF